MIDDPRYVRFGQLPRRSRPKNLLTDKNLPGLSVYEGRLREDRGFVIDTSGLNFEIGIPSLIAFAATDRPAFFVEGEKVGRGPDGEPLVTVERTWPVPKTMSITCMEAFAQNALREWSRGPRDGSGTAFFQWRLRHEDSPYLYEGVVFEKRPSGRPADKEGRRRQKQARKKQRRKK